MIIICRHEIVRKKLKLTTLIPVGVAADHLVAEVVAVAVAVVPVAVAVAPPLQCMKHQVVSPPGQSSPLLTMLHLSNIND